MNYDKWIKQNYPTKDSVKRKCAEITQEICQHFPELIRCRGYVLINLRYRQHWWCWSTKTGEIVDPTKHQWDFEPIDYHQIPQDAEEPHGKCYNCGNLLFRSEGAESHFCNECKGKEIGI